MDTKVTCEYCKYFAPSKVIRKKVDEDSDKRKKRGPVRKRCIASGKKIDIESTACDFFDPAAFFHCARNHQRIAFIQCINRRRNEKGLKTFDDCRKCRQWDTVIKHIAEDYWLKGRKPLSPKKSIRRRQKKESTIRRREKPVRESTIRRRQKPVTTIRRREKPKKVRRREKKPKPDDRSLDGWANIILGKKKIRRRNK